MEKEKTEVIFLPKAVNAISQITLYVEQQGYPQRAERFGHALYDFGYTLNNNPDRYPPCRQPQLAKQNVRCAIFYKNYIFVYKVVKNTIVVFNIIHSKTNPLFYAV